MSQGIRNRIKVPNSLSPLIDWVGMLRAKSGENAMDNHSPRRSLTPKVSEAVGTSPESANLAENELSQVAGGKPTAQPSQSPQKQQYLTVEMTDAKRSWRLPGTLASACLLVILTCGARPGRNLSPR